MSSKGPVYSHGKQKHINQKRPNVHSNVTNYRKPKTMMGIFIGFSVLGANTGYYPYISRTVPTRGKCTSWTTYLSGYLYLYFPQTTRKKLKYHHIFLFKIMLDA